MTRRPTAAPCWRMVRLRRSTNAVLICQPQAASALLDRLTGAEHDTVPHADQTAPPHGLDHLGVAQLRERHPAWLGERACGLAALWLDPLAKMGEERGGVL